jgi:nucleotide-binding universal stress UspA family protein
MLPPKQMESVYRKDWSSPMAAKAIISYDDTLNDHDALMLGRILAKAGAELTLAYVRHTTETQSDREELEEADAERLLARGARWLDHLEVDRRVLVSASTGEGLKRLAEQEEADIVVFGSDYRTAAGHVVPQHSAWTLLEGGGAAVAIAPANYRSSRSPEIHRIGVLATPGDDLAIETARALAERFQATLSRDERQVDLLVVGSRAEAPEGRVMLTSYAQNEIENATCPVLVLPRGSRIQFEAPIYVA